MQNLLKKVSINKSAPSVNVDGKTLYLIPESDSFKLRVAEVFKQVARSCNIPDSKIKTGRLEISVFGPNGEYIVTKLVILSYMEFTWSIRNILR